jgi:putative iron-dependent peroxidase
MPFGRPGHGEFGTYFIGYSRSPRTIEQMLENMFVGRPPGNYDRILDFSTAVTGSLFFVPTASFLDSVSPDAPGSTPSPDAQTSTSIAPSRDGSLGIRSLKGDDSQSKTEEMRGSQFTR